MRTGLVFPFLNEEKRRSIFSYLKNQKTNVYLLQETFSNSKDEKIWVGEWGGPNFLLAWFKPFQGSVCSHKTKLSPSRRNSGTRFKWKIYNIVFKNIGNRYLTQSTKRPLTTS